MNIFSTIVQNFKELMGEFFGGTGTRIKIQANSKIREMATSKYWNKKLLRFILLIQFVLLPLILITYLQIEGADVELNSEVFIIVFFNTLTIILNIIGKFILLPIVVFLLVRFLYKTWKEN